MNDRDAILPNLAQMDPRPIIRFLEHRDYVEVHRDDHYVTLFNDTVDESFVVPLMIGARNYAFSLLHILESFVTPEVGLDDVFARIVIPECDISRCRIEGDASWGTASFERLEQAIASLRGLWRFAAAGVVSQQRRYTRLPKLAEYMDRACRFGQTEWGSFIVKVYSPADLYTMVEVGDPGLIEEVTSEEGVAQDLGREITNTVVDNLAFIVQGEGLIDPAEMPATLNSNFIQYALALTMEASPAELSVNFGPGSARRPASGGSVRWRSSSAQRAARVQEYFQAKTEFEQIDAQGYVTDLHQDRPRREEDVRLLQQITLELSLPDVGWRKVRMNVAPDLYSRALRWNGRKELIRVVAALDKRTSPWTATQVTRIEPVFRKERGLFD